MRRSPQLRGPKLAQLHTAFERQKFWDWGVSEISIPPKALEWFNSAGTLVHYYASGYEYPVVVGSQPAGVTQVGLPPRWAGRKMHVAIWWRPADNNAGNVVWRVYARALKDGTSLSGITGFIEAVTVTDATHSAQYTISKCEVSGDVPSDIGDHAQVNLRLERLSDDAADTYAGSIYLIGVRLYIT